MTIVRKKKVLIGFKIESNQWRIVCDEEDFLAQNFRIHGFAETVMVEGEPFLSCEGYLIWEGKIANIIC